MYQIMYDCTDLRLDLHNYIYSTLSDELLLFKIDDNIANCKKIEKYDSDNKIIIYYRDKIENIENAKEEINKAFYQFINSYEVQSILQHELTKDKYTKYKYISCELCLLPNLYNLTFIDNTAIVIL